MAAGKKSFVLYTDYDTIFEQLTDEEAGQLIKHLFRYVNDKEPEIENRMLRILFEPIKKQLKRDLKKWDKALKRKSDGGKKGMASRWKDNIPKDTITTDKIVKDTLTPITDTGIVTDTVNDNVTVNDAEVEILSNAIQFEKICMNTNNSDLDFVKNSLRKFHLHLQENDRYPQKRSQIFAGFEKWLLKEKKNTHGLTTIEKSTRHKGAGILIAGLKQDYAARRKEDT